MSDEGDSITEILVPRARYGFEVILMVLMDDNNPDRKYRKMLLDPNLSEIGMVQVSHPQYDFINLLILKRSRDQGEPEYTLE